MFNPKDHIYDGSMFPHCMGQSDGSRKCPICGKDTNDMLPTTWWHSGIFNGKETGPLKPYHAFFCKEHKPEDIKWKHI